MFRSQNAQAQTMQLTQYQVIRRKIIAATATDYTKGLAYVALLLCHPHMLHIPEYRSRLPLPV